MPCCISVFLLPLAMRFSQRIGSKPLRTVLQVESMDVPLKNRLWNLILEEFFNKLNDEVIYPQKVSYRASVYKLIWTEFYGERVDLIPVHFNRTISTSGVIEYIQQWYFIKAGWDDIYDLIEFLCSIPIPFLADFSDKCNQALTKEVSGYRIINKLIVRITSEEEILSIEEAITHSDKFKVVNTHLKSAVEFLADRKSPDYRNSIKESISAVEAMCILIVEDPKASLSKALATLEKHHSLHTSLKEAYLKIYGYTSDANGIRHAMLEDGAPIEFEDAKFMLVSCSAFINYLKAKLKL